MAIRRWSATAWCLRAEVRDGFAGSLLNTVLWLLGLVTSYTMGGFVHVLLVLAIIAVLLRPVRGKAA
jgi:hypothetical protein